MLKKILPGINDSKRRVLLAVCIVLAFFIGIIDYKTGEYVITVVYIIPIYLAAKIMGKLWCNIVTLLCMVEIISISRLSHPGSLSATDIYMWNAIVQAIQLAVAGYIISIITKQLERDPKSR
ncbi:hypothetical protein [Pelotalea chapellei]|uniref:Uncharacterized protein n=1 Tax=Pelotalea chapellei TaxID=44671 RepID=A0ABS5U962_9BACT|nr:hypothetical protein [Pelotalea chapellei]MBT1072209.1 hypothetical protein [Pelotalea chapellei]